MGAFGCEICLIGWAALFHTIGDRITTNSSLRIGKNGMAGGHSREGVFKSAADLGRGRSREAGCHSSDIYASTAIWGHVNWLSSCGRSAVGIPVTLDNAFFRCALARDHIVSVGFIYDLTLAAPGSKTGIVGFVCRRMSDHRLLCATLLNHPGLKPQRR